MRHASSADQLYLPIELARPILGDDLYGWAPILVKVRASPCPGDMSRGRRRIPRTRVDVEFREQE
jgi:hypothetical protein